MNWCYLIFVFVAIKFVNGDKVCCDEKKDVENWERPWKMYPSNPSTTSWSVEKRIPMISDFQDAPREERGKLKVKKKYKRFILPLLLAYKLKFFTLIPVLIGGLILLTGATGLAGFFFALFAAVMGLKSGKN